MGQPRSPEDRAVIRRHGAELRALLMVTDAAIAIMVVMAVYAFRYAVTPALSPIDSFGSVIAPILL